MGWFHTLWYRLFGPAKTGGDGVLWAVIECDRCHERIPVRIDPRTDLQSEYREPGESGPWYTLHKEVMGNRCYALIHLYLEFGQHRNITAQQVSGGQIRSLGPEKPDDI